MVNSKQPAYPTFIMDENGNVSGEFRGLTKRELIAAMADIPWNAVLETLDIRYPERKGLFTIEEVTNYRASMKVIEADALLSELD